METKICNRCNIEKQVAEFSPTTSYKDKKYYRGECKLCNREIQKTPHGKAVQKKYRSTKKYENTRKEYRSLPEVRKKERDYEHTPEGRKSARERKMRLYYSDPLTNLKVKLRARFRQSLTAKNLNKQKSVAKLIGISLPEFKKYIEKQFQSGMSWENSGSFHIDHKIPLDSANTEKELYDLWHYTNLQPLYPKDNLTKSYKMENIDEKAG